MYGIPIGADDRVLLRNQKIFRENAADLRAAGLDPERPPRTWQEMLRYERALTQWNADGSLKRAGFMPNFGNTWLYLFGFQNNARFMNADLTRCTLVSPETEQALRFMIAGLRPSPEGDEAGGRPPLPGGRHRPDGDLPRERL